MVKFDEFGEKIPKVFVSRKRYALRMSQKTLEFIYLYTK